MDSCHCFIPIWNFPIPYALLTLSLSCLLLPGRKWPQWTSKWRCNTQGVILSSFSNPCASIMTKQSQLKVQWLIREPSPAFFVFVPAYIQTILEYKTQGGRGSISILHVVPYCWLPNKRLQTRVKWKNKFKVLPVGSFSNSSLGWSSCTMTH